jgi:hypothetical protein
MTRWFKIGFMMVFLMLGTSPASAADLSFELQFASPLSEPTGVTIAYEGLFPVGGIELAAGASSATVFLSGLEPGGYQLYLSVASNPQIRIFDFTLSTDGTVQFQSVPGLEQMGNTVIFQE